MYGVFINQDFFPYANMIICGLKTIETRNKNMLGKIVGERVAIIATGKGHKPMIIGYATISKAIHVTQEEFEQYRNEAMIEAGDPYDCNEKGKWLYFMEDPYAILPVEMPKPYVYHGRSYCEI